MERVNDEMKVISINLIMDAVKDQRKGIFDASESEEKGEESGEEGMDRPDEDQATKERL